MGKRAGTGEIRNWAGGRKFQKQGDGSWKEIVENRFKNISDYAERAIKGEVQIERLSPEEEQGRLRAGKRNVEATLLCGASQRTDSENTSQFSRIDQEETLRDWAKSEGIWVDYWGQKKYWDFIGEGAEARVYILPGGNRVKKVVWYGFSHEEPINYLDRLALHNFLFPDVPYELVGLTATDRGFAFIVEQPFVKGVVNSSKQDVIGEMGRMGFTDRGGNMFTNDDYIVEDLHSGNVVKDESGSLYFIDPIVSLNEEGEGYGGKRKYGKISMTKTEIKKSMNIFPQVKEYFEQLLSRDSKLTVENGIEVTKNLIEKAKRAQVGEIRTRSGQKFQKMGDGSWKPVKEGGKKPAKEEEGDLRQSKKGEEQPKPSKGELKVYAKNTSEASLQGAIKGSADPEIRKLAHEELERRKKEEAPQEEGKVEGKKEEVKGRRELAPKFTELSERHSLSRLPVGIPENEVEVNEDGSKGNWILKWVDPKTGKQMTSYSKEFLQQNAQEKWNRIKNVSSKDISSITSNSQKLLSSENPKEAQSAAIVNIIAMTGLRPGSQKGFDETQNRGVTTLAKENVKINGSKIYFEFTGKSYKNNTAEIDSKPLAEYLGKLMKEKKDRDFLFDVDDKTVRGIFKEKISPKSEIKLKDMRTYVATDLARSVLEDSKIPPPPVPEKGLKTAVKKKLTEVFKIVSEQLNNTPSMAKSSYVHPEVIDSWLKSLGVELAGFSKGIELDKLVSNENDEGEEDVEEYPLPEWWEDEEEGGEDEIEKGISEEKTPKEIADHHGVSFKKILEQLKMGVQVEYEHTDDTIEARRIALDHLMEIPDYYTRLAKMEAEAKGDIEKAHKDLSKYIKKRKLVTRGGVTFLQTVYENPEGVESLDKDKVEKELERTYDFPVLATGEHITIKGKKKSITGELIRFYEYKGELYLTVKGSDGKSSEILVKSAKETPITKEEGKRTAEKAFPTEFDPSKVGTVLGGFSEVRLYDEKFVLKTARERDSGVRQLQYGQIVDDVYRLMEIDTPKSKLFGDKKITEFVKGTEYGNLNNLTKLRIDKELQKGFLLDCVLANWDVIGANGDNVILGDDGKVYRIDNDGVFDLRARGGYKDFDFKIQPTIDSMIKHNSQFKDIPREKLARQAEELYKNRELIRKRILAENINFKEISNRVVSRIEDAYKIFTAKEEKPKKEEPKPWEGSKGVYGSSTTNEYFKDWDSFEFEGNEGVKDAIKKKITEVERDQESSYKGLASRLGMGVEEFKYKLQKSLEETIQQCDFFTAQGFEEHDGSTVDKIFKSGRFKTQFDPELKKERVTGGSFDPENRSRTEKSYFGFTDDKRIHENRPVYGYWTGNTNGILNSKGGIPPPNRLSQYGNVNFKVKGEKVLKSATFALEDSLGRDHRMACTPVAKPHFTSLALSEYDTNIFERLELLKSGKLHKGANCYVEAQYHGGLSLKDIESVHISKDHLYKVLGAKEYSKEEVASSVSKLANLMIEHGAKSGNMIKLKTF